jgi:hypothetical protein
MLAPLLLTAFVLSAQEAPAAPAVRAAQPGQPAQPGQDGAPAYFDVPLTELVEGLPGATETIDWALFQRIQAQAPRAVLEGEGEAVVHLPDAPESWNPVPRLAEGRLHVRVPATREVRGRLFLPDLEGEGAEVPMTVHPFTLAADRATADGTTWMRVASQRYAALSERRIPGGAWFRNRRAFLESALGDTETTPDELPLGGGQTEDPMLESLSLFMGGRAVSENLQLERLLPIASGEEETVPLDTIEGIEIRPFDWEHLLDEEPPALDALAAFVPADQHAAFFASFRAFSAIHAEVERGEGFLAGLDQQAIGLASVRDRLQAQLALPWNAVLRAFGERAIVGVAITGGDPYYPSGTDVAVLFETAEPAALLALVVTLRSAAAPDTMVVEGETLGVAWSGVETPGRVVSSYAAALDRAVVVSNSRAGLAAVVRAAQGETPRLGETDEYRFFRQRYRIDEETDRALVVVPDEAIRRWCGPRWRIAASRRVRAAAVLADLQARNLDACIDGRQVRMRPDPRFPLGGLQLLPSGIASSEYGTLGFQTPIRELELERVGKREAELYESWRAGYERNWSTFFDPIAIELDVTEDGLRADVTVLPLIDFSDYDDMRSYVGDATLGATDGDPHADTLVHYTMALDREAEAFAEYRMLAASMLQGVGADPFAWVGDFVSLYVDRDEEFLAGLEAGGAAWSEAPAVLHVDVASGLKLVAFLTALRTLAEQMAPGVVAWDEEVEGEHRFVRLSSAEVDDDAALYYATTPNAWLVSLDRAALVRALERAQAGEPAPPAPWAGHSVGFEVTREGLVLLEILDGTEVEDNLRRLAWDRLPILNEWKRRYPDRDPVELHATFWNEHLRCPGGGTLEWDEELGTMASSIFGSPARPGEGVALPPGLDFERISFGLLFEHDGVRARAALAR